MSSITLPSLNIELIECSDKPRFSYESELFTITDDGAINFETSEIYFNNPRLSHKTIVVRNESIIIVGNVCSIRSHFSNNGRWNRIEAGNFLTAEIGSSCFVMSGNASTIWCNGSGNNIKVGKRSTIYNCVNSYVCSDERGLVVFNHLFSFVPPTNLEIIVKNSENWTTKVSEFAKWSNKTPEELLYMNIKFGDLISRESINSEFGLNL